MSTVVDIKPIPEVFNKKGFQYRQIKREGDRAIFEQKWLKGETVRYEVVKIGRHNGYSMGGSYIEPAETYPGSSLWGISGWTCTTLDDANKRYDALNS